MGKYILKRILLMIPVLLGVSLLIFFIMSNTPGDPAAIILGSEATQEQIARLREEMGLNRPFFVRYFEYIKNIVLHFDFGKSFTNNVPVKEELLGRFSYTLRVAIISIIISLVTGVPLGIVAAVNRNNWKDNAAMGVALFGVSMPSFWIGLMLSLLFALKLGWLPSSGIGSIKHYIMPCLAVSFGGTATLARQTRSSMLEVIRADYISTARAKGQTERKVIYSHALRNALIPVITVAGGNFGILMGGALVNETVFGIPGVGTYMVTSIKGRDYPAVQGAVLLVAIAFGIIMLLVDILYAAVDPRIRAQFSKGGK